MTTGPSPSLAGSHSEVSQIPPPRPVGPFHRASLIECHPMNQVGVRELSAVRGKQLQRSTKL